MDRILMKKKKNETCILMYGSHATKQNMELLTNLSVVLERKAKATHESLNVALKIKRKGVVVEHFGLNYSLT